MSRHHRLVAPAHGGVRQVLARHRRTGLILLAAVAAIVTLPAAGTADVNQCRWPTGACSDEGRVTVSPVRHASQDRQASRQRAASQDRAASRVEVAPQAEARSAPAPTAAPAAPTAAVPVDLTNWYLTLPTGQEGDPDTVHAPELASYSSRWFHVDRATGGLVFTANAGGATTSGSDYPRSELREMDGDQKAAWSNTSGTHTLHARQAVTALPSVKPEVVTAQIHDGSDDVLEVRLEGTTLIAQYDDGKTDVTLDPGYVLGTVFDIRIVASDGRVQVFYNGARKVDIARAGSSWYFKSGSYVQSNTDKGDEASAVGTVVLHELEVTHRS